jgi:hypothetical protein
MAVDVKENCARTYEKQKKAQQRADFPVAGAV